MIVYLSRDNKINNHKFTEYFLFAEVIALANNKEQLFYHETQSTLPGASPYGGHSPLNKLSIHHPVISQKQYI